MALTDYLDKLFSAGTSYLEHTMELETIEAKAALQTREAVEQPQQPNASPVTSPVSSNPRQAVMPFDPTWQGLKTYVAGLTPAQWAIGAGALLGAGFLVKKVLK